jgi:hypothetical protein
VEEYTAPNASRSASDNNTRRNTRNTRISTMVRVTAGCRYRIEHQLLGLTPQNGSFHLFMSIKAF